MVSFITEDSYEGNITNPLNLNLYTYCENEPLGNVDPNGHSMWFDEYIPYTESDKEEVNRLGDQWNLASDNDKSIIHAWTDAIREKYVDLIKIDGKEYIDYSDKANNMVSKNMKECKENKDGLDMGRSVLQQRVSGTTQETRNNLQYEP